MTASAKQNDTTSMEVIREPQTKEEWEQAYIAVLRRAHDAERELTAARAEAEALRKALRLIAEDANLSVIAQERVGNKDSAKAWTVMRDRAIDAVRSGAEMKK